MARYYRTTRARQTGRPITVGHADVLGLGNEDGQTAWYTICDDHAQCVGHETLALARAFAADPLTWCEVCNGNDGEEA